MQQAALQLCDGQPRRQRNLPARFLHITHRSFVRRPRPGETLGHGSRQRACIRGGYRGRHSPRATSRTHSRAPATFRGVCDAGRHRGRISARQRHDHDQLTRSRLDPPNCPCLRPGKSAIGAWSASASQANARLPLLAPPSRHGVWPSRHGSPRRRSDRRWPHGPMVLLLAIRRARVPVPRQTFKPARWRRGSLPSRLSRWGSSSCP